MTHAIYDSTLSTSSASPSGIVFDIKRFALHDGPGIRTTVFLKGCPLQCRWCHNPESQDAMPEILFDSNRCTGCGACISECPHDAILSTTPMAQTDRDRCVGCGACVPVCPSQARSLLGKTVRVDELVSEIESDTPFFDESGGGVTLSGGEPLYQPRFAAALLAACQRLRMHTALDTCGFAAWKDLEQVAQVSDLVLYDLKLIDEAQHKRWTGQSNTPILDSLFRLDKMAKPLWIRIPLIPGVNDDSDSWHAMADTVSQLKSVEAIHLLPYHRAGEAKWRKLDKETPGIFSEPESVIVQAAAVLISEATGLEVHVGG